MQTAIQKASVLIEALPYIQKFRGSTIVVKFGGSVMENSEAVRGILEDVAFMECVGLRPVLVHGGGKAISRKLDTAGIKSHFHHGLRVTDAEAMQVVEGVLNHGVNPPLVEMLNSFGCKARGIHGDQVIKARKHVVTDPESGEHLDWGLVGEVSGVDEVMINVFLSAGMVPVVTPLGRGDDDALYNLNADEAAAGLAKGLKARKLVFLSDVPGLLADPADPDSLISTVTASEVETLKQRGIISGGMIPKMDSCIKALEAGVHKIHIIDVNQPHSLLLEMFTEQGVGTEITA